MLRGFDHTTIVVRDLESATGFFGLLGFRQTRAVVVSGDVMSAYMGIEGWEADHVTLELPGAPGHQEVQLLRFHRPAPHHDEGSGDLARTGFNHLCFAVDDLDATLAELAAGGVRPRNEILDFHDRRLVFLDGPEHVVIELAEWSAGAVSPPA